MITAQAIQNFHHRLDEFILIYPLLIMVWSSLMSGSAEYFLTFAKISAEETLYIFQKYKLSPKFIISWTYPVMPLPPYRWLAPVNAVVKILISSGVILLTIGGLAVLYGWDSLVAHGEKALHIALLIALFTLTYVFCLLYGLIIRRELLRNVRPLELPLVTVRERPAPKRKADSYLSVACLVTFKDQSRPTISRPIADASEFTQFWIMPAHKLSLKYVPKFSEGLEVYESQIISNIIEELKTLKKYHVSIKENNKAADPLMVELVIDHIDRLSKVLNDTLAHWDEIENVTF